MAKQKQRILSIPQLDITVYCPVEYNKGLVVEDLLLRKATPKFNEELDVIRDVQVYGNSYDYALLSPLRNVTIVVKNIAFQNKVSHDEATQRISSIIDLIKETDKYYKPNSQDEVDNCIYMDILRQVYEKRMRKEDEENAVRDKQAAKNSAKKRIKRKWFKIGEEYVLRKTDSEGNVVLEEDYKCVKFIYTVGKNTVNCVVMKRLAGVIGGDVRPLNVNDCRMFHIKYEPGLYMFPMSQGFYKKNVMSLEDFTASKEPVIPKKYKAVMKKKVVKGKDGKEMYGMIPEIVPDEDFIDGDVRILNDGKQIGIYKDGEFTSIDTSDLVDPYNPEGNEEYLKRFEKYIKKEQEIRDEYRQEKYSLLKAEMPEIERELKLKELKWRYERRMEELKETRLPSVF
jgi:hypothetical protein